MTLHETIERLREFRISRGWRAHHTPRNLSAALAVEAAELQELFLWSGSGWRTVDDRRGDVESELADIVIYALNFADVAGIDVLAAVDRKIKRNESRFPVRAAA